jgi:3',5'-cyclic AMP phosphodiesterase CpdA
MRLIAHISDLHFGRHDPAAVDALAASLSEHRPHLVVISGDLTQRARRLEFIEARTFLDRIAQPKLVVPGNHDVPLYNVVARFFSPLKKYDRYVAPVNVPGGFFADEEIAVLGINTARSLTIKDGRVSHEQMEEIRRKFATVASHRFKVLVTHHPLGTPDTADIHDVAGRSRLALRAAAEAGIELLLSGHHHAASSGEIDAETALDASMLLVHAGTAVSTRVRGEHGNSYNLIKIDGATLTVSVMAYAPSGFRESQSASYRLEKGRWRQTD